jgi:hypothetical protein
VEVVEVKKAAAAAGQVEPVEVREHIFVYAVIVIILVVLVAHMVVAMRLLVAPVLQVNRSAAAEQSVLSGPETLAHFHQLVQAIYELVY